MKYFYPFFIVVFLFSLLYSCKEEKDERIISIHLNVTNLELNVGDEYQFTVMHEPGNLPTPSCQWQIYPTSGATISETGLLKVYRKGTYKVTVETWDETTLITLTSSCDVIVNDIPVSKINLEYNSLSLTIGEEKKISYTLEPENTTVPEIKWESSNPNVATVSNNGTINGIGIGECIITAYSTVNPIIKSNCTVNVSAPPLEKISIPEKVTLTGYGVEKWFEVFYYPEQAKIQSVTAKSSDEKVATITFGSGVVPVGIITSVGTGTCFITVTTIDGNHSDTCEVEVLPQKTTGIAFLDIPKELGVGNSFNLGNYVSIEPHNATNRNFTLQQLNGFDIVSLDANNNVTGLKAGEALFKVTSQEGEYSDICLITVVDAVVTKVSVSLNLSGWANIGGYLTSSFTCYVTNLNDKPITVTSFRVLPSSGGGNSNSAIFNYYGIIEPHRAKYWTGRFNNIYNPYYLLYFEYEGKTYIKKI